MSEASCGLGFLAEARKEGRIGCIRLPQAFYGHAPPQKEVVGPVHDSHATLATNLDYSIAVGDGLADESLDAHVVRLR
jgi:hypothetical protein